MKKAVKAAVYSKLDRPNITITGDCKNA